MKASRNHSAVVECPCGYGLAYAQCCGRYHDGALPETAERLMRSRYCAYVLKLEHYVLATWHASTRPAPTELRFASDCKWLQLDIVRHVQLDEKTAIVEFVARYKVSGRAQRLHESSRFIHEQGRWFYVDGEFP